MTHQKNILVVEDEELIAMAVADDIADIGNPFSVSTEAEALNVLRNNDIHFAVVDYHLRHGTSRNVIAVLQQRNIPFVICTGSAPDVEGGALAGLSQLPKPYLTSHLRKVVAAALELRPS